MTKHQRGLYFVELVLACLIVFVAGDPVQVGNSFPAGVVLNSPDTNEACEVGTVAFNVEEDDLLACTSTGWFRVKEAVELLSFALSEEGGGGGLSLQLLSSLRYCSGNGNYSRNNEGKGFCDCYDSSAVGHWSGSRCESCTPGWTGPDCREDVDECALDVSGELCQSEGSECQNTVGSFECLCDDGYVGNGTVCTDINECDTNNGDCNQICVNEPGTHHCECNTGFEFEEASTTTCVNIDECVSASHGCDADATCFDTEGSYDCLCNPAFVGDGLSCTPVSGLQDSDRLPDCLPGLYDSRDHSIEYSALSCEELLATIGFGSDSSDTNGGSPEVCGDVDNPGGVCYPSGQWAAADSHCKSIGARLCTKTDLELGEPAGTGCSYDNYRLWSSTPCGTDSYYTLAGAPTTSGIPTECRSATENLHHRCCADSASRLLCDVCPSDHYCPPANSTDDPITCPSGSTSLAASKRVEDCKCRPGYFGPDGGPCTDYDECIGENGGNNCHSEASCTNVGGSFTCTCNAGYTGNGVTCDPVCGDGLKTDGEECDDGNTDDNDGCSSTCSQIETGFWCDLQGSTDDALNVSICSPCASGTYNDVPGREEPCIACPAGFGCDDASVSPVPCSDGTYSLEGVASCEPCPENHYCPNTDEAPLACPLNFVSDAGASNIEACGCVSGFELYNLTSGEFFSFSGSVEALVQLSSGDIVCSDADECIGEGDGHNCDINSYCFNNNGSFSCMCHPGYIGDGVSCSVHSSYSRTNPPCTLPGLFSPGADDAFGLSQLPCEQIGFEDAGGSSDICGDANHNGQCYGTGQSYAQAKSICEGFGGRLCELTEVQNYEVSGTGCSYDAYSIWTRTECDLGGGVVGYYSIPGNPDTDGIPTQCSSQSSGHAVRCCGDAAVHFRCLVCDADYYCPDPNGARIACPPHSTSLAASKRIEDCTCLSGFSGPDGGPCIDLDECIGENGGHNCHTEATCNNNNGSFSCSCNAGYSGDGVSCTSVCGDGLKTDDEECDDGNTSGGDGCSADCRNIETGHWCDLQGSTNDNLQVSVCAPCESGTYNDATGRQAPCVDCPAGHDCTDPALTPSVCSAGTYSEEGEGPCSACPVGSYCPNADELPVACPTPLTSEEGQDDLNDCTCVPGLLLFNTSSQENIPLPVDFTTFSPADFANMDCIDLNECIGEGGGHNCNANAECSNTDGSFECQCSAGYYGDGVTCTPGGSYSRTSEPCTIPGLYTPGEDEELALSSSTCQQIGFEDAGGSSEICGDANHNGECYGTSRTYAQAKGICEGFGGRLCSLQEIQNSEVSGTGCSYDGFRIWSRTECDLGGGQTGYYTMAGHPGTGGVPLQCTAESTQLAVRCCGDASSRFRCDVCSAGYYCPDPSQGRIPCPSGQTSLIASKSLSDCS